MNNFCKVTHDLNEYLDGQDKLEQITEAKQIALENDLECAFTSGKLDEEFYHIDEEAVYTREEVINECADELCESETLVNLFSLNVSDEVKLKILSDIREKIIVKFGGEV